jgi:transposase
VTLTIHFTPSTVKALTDLFQAALRRGDQRLVKRIAGLLFLADGFPVARAASRVGVSESTLYSWLKAFVHARFASLRYRKSPGRPAKLTPTQKRRLSALIEAGPEAAGYRTGCWNSALIQGLIHREFGVLYNMHYVAELLRNLGFS